MTRKLLTHRVIESSPGVIYIPYLLLLGILLCASSKLMKAEAYYNMFKKENSEHIQMNDVDLGEFTEKLCEISYALVIRMHGVYHPESDKSKWILDHMDGIYKDIVKEEFLPAIFDQEEKLTKIAFC